MRGTTVREVGLPRQYWFGHPPFNAAKVGENTWPTLPDEKPNSGFFTSSSRDWAEWVGDQPRGREDRVLMPLEPHPHARLYVINCCDDYWALRDAYPQRSRPAHPRVCPNWGKLANERFFDGVHVTVMAVRAAKVARDTDWMHFGGAWEVESTLWFRWRPVAC